jgi:hypothetical protein
LFTKVTCEPRATMIVAGLTPADVIVIVRPPGAGVGVGVGVGLVDGDVLPPPHAIVNAARAARAAAARTPQVVFFAVVIRCVLSCWLDRPRGH